MTNLVIKVSISSMCNHENDEFTSFVQVYDVTSIKKKVNATLRHHTDDIKKRFELDAFDKIHIESDLKSNRASIMFLVHSEIEVDVKNVVESLKVKIIEKMNEQLIRFEKYKNNLEKQKVYREVKYRND